MKNMLDFVAMLCVLASLTACNAPDPEYKDEHKVSTTPLSLECGSEAAVLQLNVNADDSWQAYAADDCNAWVSSVEPSWSQTPSGTITVKVSENLSKSPRSGNIIIKCGTTRHKVSLTQAAYIPEQGSISCPI